MNRIMQSVTPVFHSLALRDIPQPDYADMCLCVLPQGASNDPAVWAQTLFSAKAMPRWVVAAILLRQLIVPLVGIPRASADDFAVCEVVGGEALLAIDDKHLDCRIAVGVDIDAAIVRVTTTVALKGWRGRLYFSFVGLIHPIVLQSMLKRTKQALANNQIS